MFGEAMTTLEGIDIMKIVNSLEESDLLIKSISEAIRNDAKKQKDGFLSMLLGTLDAGLLGNILKSKRVKRPNSFNIPGPGVMKVEKAQIKLVK